MSDVGCAPCEALGQMRCPEHGPRAVRVPSVRVSTRLPAEPEVTLEAIRAVVREELRAVGLVPRDGVRSALSREPE